MRKWFAVAILLVFLAPVQAARLENWNIEVIVDSDKSTEWIVNFNYNETVGRSDFFVMSKITGVEVKVDGRFIDCQSSAKDVGTSIVCNDIDAKRISYRFRALGLVSGLQDLNMFEYRFPVLQLVGNFTVTVKLPPGTGLVERSRLEGTGLEPFEPSWGKPDSDGRSIFVVWSQSSPLLGSSVDVKVIYENIFESQLLPLGIIGVITLSFFAVLVFMRRRPMRDILPILTDSERKVMELILQEKKPVDQRMIVKETDFSKPKVSRIIGDLETRGLVTRSRKGRTNVISMSNNLRSPKKPEKQEKEGIQKQLKI